MANQLTGDPIILDSASTSAILTRTQFRVHAVNWVIDSGGADNDELILKDAAGVVKYHDIINITTSGVTQGGFKSFVKPIKFNGLIAHTISGGTVYLYLFDSNDIVAA